MYKELSKKITPEFLKKRPVSYSSLKEFNKSPKHYLEYVFGERKTSDAMALGTMVDVILLSPENIFEYVKSESFDKRTKQGKEDYANFVSKNEGKKIVDPEIWEKAHDMVDSIRSNKECLNVINTISDVQDKILFSFDDIPCVGYRDIIAEINGKPLIVDLKTTRSADQEQFSKDFYNFNYHIQAGLYMLMEEGKSSFANMVVESSKPYNSDVLYVHPDTIDMCKRMVKYLLQEFKRCLDEERFHEGYEFWREKKAFGVVNLPKWAKIKGLI